MALSDYKTDIYPSKEIILSFCRAIGVDSDMQFSTKYSMEAAMMHLIHVGDKAYEVKVVTKTTRVESPNSLTNKDANKQKIYDELLRRFKYITFYKPAMHAGALILNDAKKTYEVKLVAKKAV